MWVLYFLPKVHEGVSPIPGCPIISARKSLCENISKYVDFFLQEFVTQLPSYLRHTGDFLLKIKDNEWSNERILMSMDITSLYTSINHIDGLRACEPFLVGRPIQCYKHELILFLIKWYLNNNFFAFDNDVYQQLRGVAMGACFSPSYACLPVGWWGERVLKTTYQVAFNNNVIAWLCYIDDVFVSWKGTAESGLKFVWHQSEWSQPRNQCHHQCHDNWISWCHFS